MKQRLQRSAIVLAATVGLAAAAAFPALGQGGPPQNIRGQVTAADASGITVRAREGHTVKIMLPAKVRISGYAKSDLAKVAKGTYIGTAAAPGPGGTLIAQEVLIFPEPMRGVGEGHRKWDLTADSTMTNATVESVVDQVKGRMLTVSYKGGSKMVMVPPGTPVVTIVRATKDEIKPGANVFVVAKKGMMGDALEAIRVGVGKDGLVPPM